MASHGHGGDVGCPRGVGSLHRGSPGRIVWNTEPGRLTDGIFQCDQTGATVQGYQHTLGGLHQSVGADHFAHLYGRDSRLINYGLQVGRAAALGHFHEVAQVQVG